MAQPLSTPAISIGRTVPATTRHEDACSWPTGMKFHVAALSYWLRPGDRRGAIACVTDGSSG